MKRKGTDQLNEKFMNILSFKSQMYLLIFKIFNKRNFSFLERWKYLIFFTCCGYFSVISIHELWFKGNYNNINLNFKPIF